MSLALDAVMTTGAAEPFLDKPEAYAPQPKADAAPLPTVRRQLAEAIEGCFVSEETQESE